MNKEIFKGLIDLHIHAGPSVMPREVDSYEMLKEAEELGYRAIVIKDHFAPTVMMADTLSKHVSKNTQVFGGIALNNSVGGLNVKALDAAYAAGAKIFWMPTVSTKNHIDAHSGGHGIKFPSSKGMSVAEKPIVYIKEDGTLIDEALEVIEYAGKKEDLILGTGHGSLREVDATIRAAFKAGTKRILVNHPFYMIGADIGIIKEWSEMGAYIELNATVFVEDSKFCSVSTDVLAEIIEKISIDNLIVDSDYGQLGNGNVSEGLWKFIEMIKKNTKATDEDIEKMTKINPAKLLGLE
ncbi:DUF6282 family protein [Anaerotignum sp.]|uniref:DUF6282 family protein n=1 Tax=Anaerotignum sp. TaxID=2039241 RepID=UPI002715538F|nr:DUF6282 family protein [Anaerotignum sp.]